MAHVLIPTDFSPNALNAALYALELYGAEGNTFTVLHCYMMPNGESTMWNITDQLAKASLEDLSAFTTSLREAARREAPAGVEKRAWLPARGDQCI